MDIQYAPSAGCKADQKLMQDHMVRIRSLVVLGFVLGVVGVLHPGAAGAACYPTPPGLIGWWKGEANTNDVLGIQPGTNAGTVLYGPGAVGQAMIFNGSNSWMQVADAPELSPHVGSSGEITLEAWIFMDRVPTYDIATGQGNRAIVVKGSPSNWEYGLYITTNMNPVFQLWTTSGSGYGGASWTNSLNTNQWYHLVGVMRKGQFTQLYVNGALAGESTAFSSDTANAGSPLYIGRRGDGQWFDGKVDEISLWGRALASGEVAGVYAAGADGKCTTSIAAAGIPYRTDFEKGIGSEWSLPIVNTAQPFGFSAFSGRFNNTPQTLTLTNLVPGQSYTVGFDFYALDSWDGNGQNDTFLVRINGQNALSYTFSNYNGEPPSSAQSFPQGPDEGRAHFGFGPSHVDAIYRNIEVTFTASNATTQISFVGSGVDGDITDESWGIDNVSVVTAASITGTVVRSTTLPEQNSTNSVMLDSFLISANWPLLTSTATNAANYTLKAAGVDGVLGNADDVSFAFVPSLPGAGGRSVRFNLTAGALTPGRYRFATLAGLQGTNGVSVPVFTRDFVIRQPVLGIIETLNNDSLATATQLPIGESPIPSGFFTGYGLGSFSSTSDIDYWRFEAEAGDRITVRVEAELLDNYPQLYIQNASGSNVETVGGSYEGIAQIQNLVISTPGTYYLRIWSTHNNSRYQVRLDQSRGIQLEQEDNGTQAAANQINLAFSSGLSQGRIAGSLPAADATGDYFKIGTLNVGNLINVTALYPTGSTFSASHPVLTVYAAGATQTTSSNLTGNLSYTVTGDGVHYVRVQSSNRDLRAQYLLNFVISDGVLPTVSGTTLPAENGATSEVLDRFNLSFSEDLAALSVSNSANYELRSAGSDDAFGTADDIPYRVVTTGYTIGLAASYLVVDGPVQPGKARLTVRNLQDRAGNTMSPAFTRNFRVDNVPGYVVESRDNYSGGTATRLGTSASTNGTGALGWISSTPTGSNPQNIAAGRFNSDTNLDVVVANWSSDSISIYTNNSLGQFSSLTNFPTGDAPSGLAVRDFNGDGLDDIAVAHYYANTVGIYLRSGNSFVLQTNMTGFSNPYYIRSADLNGDGKADLAVPNYGAGNMSVLLGNGDGTFQTRSNYAAGSGPHCVAAGDFNGDSKIDLAVANYSGATISVFTNQGSGTFVLATNTPCGPNPRFVIAQDMNKDNKTDLVVAQYGDNTVSVLTGNGNATFQSRKSYYTACTDMYECAVVDLNNDGAMDVVVPGYGNNDIGVLINDGSGNLGTLYGYDRSSNPIGIAAGDFNNDGRQDVAVTIHNGNAFEVWAGLPAALISEEPPGSGLRTLLARGRRGNSDDTDYFRFDATAGDQVVVATENPGAPGSSSLRYRILELDGSVYATWYGDGSGYGQSGIVNLPFTGSYLVEVNANNDYQGEYRLRISLSRPPLAFESEDNNSISAADQVAFKRTGNQLRGTLAGAITGNDSVDYHLLGYLQGGDTIRLTNREPASSGLAQILSIYRSTNKSSGTWMTNSAAGVGNFAFTVPSGQDGFYYVQVTAGSGGYQGASEPVLNLRDDSDSVDLGSWFNYQVFTISFWVNPAASQSQYADIMDNHHQGGINWVIQQNSSTVNQYTWGDADGSPDVLFNLVPETWQHVTITRDSTNISRVYINGTLIGTAAGTGQINYNGAQFLRIGRWGSGGRNWNGMLDDLRIWGRALNPPEVVAQMTGSLTGAEPDLIGYWAFDEGFGTVAADLSPAHRTATFAGATWTQLAPSNAMPASIAAQYILDVEISDTVAPQIVSVSLPQNGTVFSNMVNSFSMTFNDEMEPGFQKLSRNVQRLGNSSYVLTDSAQYWWLAQAAATNLGGSLVTISSAAEQSFVYTAFASSESLWIGLNSPGYRENLQWVNGEPLGYYSWSGSQPDNSSGNQSAVRLVNNGNSGWDDVSPWSNYRGIVEISSTTDTDNDGLVNLLDPYPTDAYNAFDLRAAGTDKVFDTADDIKYRIQNTDYSIGLTANFQILDGPLQEGVYRFKATTALRDRFGNPLAAEANYYFTNAPVSGFVTESRELAGNSSTTPLSAIQGGFDGSFSGQGSITTGSNPHHIIPASLNGDAHQDLIVANISSDTVGIYLGNGSGGFTVLTNLATGDGPISTVLADFDADTVPDLAVSHYYGDNVAIWRGLGGGMFVPVTNLTGFSRPFNLLAADLNGDNKIDLAIPNYNASTFFVLHGAGNGTFSNSVSYTVGSAPQTVNQGDFNKDGRKDLVVANYSGNSLSVLLGNTDGTYQAATSYAMGGNTRYVAVGDVNGDTRLDLIATTGAKLCVFFGNADGTFQTRQDYSIACDDVYDIDLVDLTGDNRLDAVISSYGNDRLIVAQNNGDGTFGPYLRYNPGGNPIGVALGDYNSDGRVDIAAIGYNGNRIYVYLGNGSATLQADPNGTGLLIGGGRGNIHTDGEVDYWSFSAEAGDRIFINTESPGFPGSASLRYELYYPNWDYWTRMYSDGTWNIGNFSLTAPVDGTYFVQIQHNNTFRGEYRLRVTLAKPPVLLESEANNTTAEADTITYTLQSGERNAKVLGQIALDDPGDYFRLGNLAANTQITLSNHRPSSSLLLPVFEIYDAASTLVARSALGSTNMVYTVGSTNAGAYFARVTWNAPAPVVGITNAIQFDGGDDYVNLGAWGPGTNWAVQAWVMPSSLPSGRRQIAGAAADYRDWGLILQDGRFAVQTRTSSSAVSVYAGQVPAERYKWYHVLATCDGTNVYLYVDGVLAASGPSDVNFTAYASSTRIGANSCCGDYFPGMIQKVAIWNKALTPVEAAQAMGKVLTGSEAGLAGYWPLTQVAGTTVPDLSTNNRTGTLVNGPVVREVSPTGTYPVGLMQQYLLGINLVNTVPPQILSVSLPSQGSATGAFIDSFGIVFSEDMDPATITNAANYELRGHGSDSVYGTADDTFYAVANSPVYTVGVGASYSILNSQLQPGIYRLTVSSNLANPVGTLLPTNYVRSFTVTNVAGYVLENRSGGTSLSTAASGQGNGSFSTGSTLSGFGTGVERIAAGYLNNDTNLDLVVTLWSSGKMGVLLGNGDGTFQFYTNYITGNQAWSVALGHLNGDTNLDAVVGNYGAGHISILTGNGNGTFQVVSNYVTGTRPYHVALGDVNNDGKMDIVVPNSSSGNVSLLLGNGNATFAPATNYDSGTTPVYAALGDVNADGKSDLVVCNYDDNNLMLRFGGGDGTFGSKLELAGGIHPRAVVINDLNKDSKQDIAFLNGGEKTVSVLLGNGDGSFRARINYGVDLTDGYELAARDLDGDGWLDLIANGYNERLNILLNRGDGTFGNPMVHTVGNGPVGLAIGDFNNDSRLDIAYGNDYGQSVGVLLGNNTQELPLDASSGLRIARGRGMLYGGSQSDTWTFDAEPGDIIYVGVENPANASASSLRYRVYRPDGYEVLDFYSDGNGRGQGSLIAPVAGQYSLFVSPNDGFRGEYRVRITIAKPPVQVESEANNDAGAADPLSFALAGSHRTATVLGYISLPDSGDWFNLGTLSEGSLVNLSLNQPQGSGFPDVLDVINSGSTVVYSSTVGASNASYVIAPGGAGNYYARVRSVNAPTTSIGQHPTGSPKTLYYGGSAYSEVLINVPEDGFTVSFWFRTSDPSAGLFSVVDGGGSHDRHLFLSGGNISSRIYSGPTISSTGLNLADNNWHHVVFTYGTAITGNRIYIDGTLAASGTKATSDFTWDNRIRFGYSQDAGSVNLVGTLDEARVWSRTFSEVEALQAMTTSLTGTEAGLIGYWRFNEGVGTISTDLTTNARNASLVGGPLWLDATYQGYALLRGLNAQYLLGLDILDQAAPVVSSVSLPAGGTTNSGPIDRFSVTVSKDLNRAINLINRDIRTRGGRGYTITDSGMSWYNAQVAAQALGGNLASVNDEGENAWLNQSFSSYGNLWIGLTDESQKNSFAWVSGDSLTYTNWASGQPNTANNKDYVALGASGQWTTYVVSTSMRGVIEVSGADTDNDGIPDSLDPFPGDPYDGIDLRATGPDGLFDTADDQSYRVLISTYTSGTSLSFSISDGPLQAGYYRFMLTSGLSDLFGNPLAASVRYFTVTPVDGYVSEGRTNDVVAGATALPLVDDPPGLRSVAGRGNLSSGSDLDYWTFPASAGDVFNLATLTVGSPGASQLRYRLFRPNGSELLDWYPSYSGEGQTAAIALPETGAYQLLVSLNYDYQGEYRFRVTVASPPMKFEGEDNGAIASANVITWTTNLDGLSGSLGGRIRVASDLDYINLGTITNGSSIFLNVRLPGSSSLVPIVSVYDSAGAYQQESAGGRANDSVANVPVTVTGTYYALIRPGAGTGGLNAQYVMDVNVVPTGSINFPNLVVTGAAPPSGSGIISGQEVVYSFTVANVGNAPTVAANWVDRAVISLDQVLGNQDDIPLGFFPHAGILAVSAGYDVTKTFRLPDGISGDYYLIIQTDAGNAVNEYLFKGDNTTVSTNTFHVDVAPYPDVVVEDLKITGPDASHKYTITWNTANRGTATAPAGFTERVVVRNQSSGSYLLNTQYAISSALTPNQLVAGSRELVTTNAGDYLVQVITDTGNALFEFNTNGHAVAEANNSASAGFQIVAYYQVSVSSVPPGAGSLSGSGTFASGTAVSVSAIAVTNVLPYYFVNWTEGSAFQSASSNYTFVLSRDRTLVANFALPTFQIAVSNNPSAGGTVAGAGSYAYGTTNVLTANAGFGYRFTNWTEAGSVIGTQVFFTNIVTSNRFLVANYLESNVRHVVTTGSSPTNVAVVAGAGTYTNGQTAQITAPVSVTNPPNIYNFKQFTLNGAPAGNSASFSKTFSTLDPTNMQYVAMYDTVSILPLLTNVIVSQQNPVPATTNFNITLQFNRSMNTNFAPLVVLTNSGASVQAVVPPGGIWSSTSVSNDTFAVRPVTFSTGMDGNHVLFVSQARDMGGAELARTNARTIVVDVTPPSHPALTLTSSNNSSATVTWSAYAAPTDLGSFRVYLASNNFTSVAGMTPVSSLGSAARSYAYHGLSLDRPYYAAVAAVDVAGNSRLAVTPLVFTLPSSVPPPVTIQVAGVAASSANISWNSYNASGLLGFAGFRLYYETTNYVSVASLTPKQVLGSSTRSFQADGLDRTKTYYFAVVGYNVNGAANSNVTTAAWSDPYAGVLTANITIGGAGQVVDILQSMTVSNNAVLTVPAGTTLRFAPGTGLRVLQGALVANGTALDPVVFTSSRDRDDLAAAAGDWRGISLETGSGNSSLRHVYVKYGMGLSLSNTAPKVDAFTALYNAPAGLSLTNGAVLNTTNTLLAYNAIGARQLGTAQLGIRGSVLKNNDTNALAAGGSALAAQGNWWGTAASSEIDATLRGTIDKTGFLTGEPLLTPAIGIAGNVTQVGMQTVNLRLACRTADSMRLSENSTFFAVFFAQFTNTTPFTLSDGGGEKTIFAQFRSTTGETSAPVSLTINYITAGPSISGFNLSEGQLLSRPLRVTATAAAPLGMSAIEFYVDGVGQATNAGGSFSHWFDIHPFSSAVHRVRLVARDTSGNFASLERNVTITPVPPSAPTITEPANDLVVNTNAYTLAGNSEPFVNVRLVQNGQPLPITPADFRGKWYYTNVALVEGSNAFTATAFDLLGSANSGSRVIVRDSGPPAALVMDSPSYNPASGLSLTWRFANTGERATRFRVLWHTNTFNSTAQASGQSPILTAHSYTVSGLKAGTYYFAVAGFDDAGNGSPLSNLISYNYDPVPPAFSLNFDKGSPVGVGALRITVTSSKPLANTPSFTLRPSGAQPVALLISNTAFNTYEGTLNVTPSTPSGLIHFTVAGEDLVGNKFNGSPVGPVLVIDVTPPTGIISTIPGAPIQATNSTNVAISLALSEPVKPGTIPTLSFTPPVGAVVAVPLSGSGSNWAGTLSITPIMGSGYGNFAMTARDALDNVGQVITAGLSLEIYNTAVPAPPAQPVNFHWSSLAGGQVRLTWNAVSNAETYRVYREPGTNLFQTPTVLAAEMVSSNSYTDLPAADGSYRYVVSAVRRGSEGTNSIVRAAVSDRTPPGVPGTPTVQLLANGVRVVWTASAGEVPNYYRVYRNGTQISTVGATTTNITDSPPRGVMSYRIAAGDSLGNEALSGAASIELLVGAVSTLAANVTLGQPPVLSWVSSDNTAVGFNLYRNGVKQNTAPLPTPAYTDNLGIPPMGSATYTVRAVNATNAESAPRTITVSDVGLGLRANLIAGYENPPVTYWFDKLKVSVTNRANVQIPLDAVSVARSLSGSGYTVRGTNAETVIGAGNWFDTEIVFPAGTNSGLQNVRVQAIQSELDGSSVVYQRFFNYDSIIPLGAMVDVTPTQQPLAGGLATFGVTFFNRGYADMDVLVSQNNGAEPGEVYLSVIDRFGQEVGRTQYKGTPAGTFFSTDGRGFLRIPAGGSRSFNIGNVLVPDALGTNLTQFRVVAPRIYYRLGSVDEAVAGPLVGSAESSLALTPYYGTAQTDNPLYANDAVVKINGQAIDRQTGLPKANAPLKIGFFTRGYQFYYQTNTDAGGNYVFNWTPMPGLSGTFNVWAAHPDVFDVLKQAEFKLYRCYLSPTAPDIRMSKNDTINFSVTLVNPGDENLTDFALASQAYQMVGTNRTPISTITATSLNETNFGIGQRQSTKVSFQIQAALDAPDQAQIDLVFTSAEGASASCTATLTLLPANPLLSVQEPSIGYAEVSVNRGSIASRTITVVNRGLRALQGVTIQPPTNINWMSINLPLDTNGLIRVADLPIGGSNTFTAVFAPPTNAPLEYVNDFVVVRGTNSPADFKVNLYALVTSSQKGKVRFTVDDILVLPVPNANIRIKNTILEQEYTLRTDANGVAEIDNLQEGVWAWQVSAPGHSANVGTVEVIANQVVAVDTRLSRSLVTVSFTVTPVPFTDRYEITIEQTFETHVPAPVIVFKPSLVDFKRVSAGFDATFMATLKNEGLIDAQDVQVVGSVIPQGRLTPLINYFPRLKAQQSVEIPMHFEYFGYNVGTNGTGAGLSTPCGRKKCFGYDIDSEGNITPQPGLGILQNYNDFNKYPCTGGAFDLEHFLGALNAIADACAPCADLKTAMHLVTGLVTHFEDDVIGDVTGGLLDALSMMDTLAPLFGCPGGAGGGNTGGSGSGSSSASSGPRGFSSYSGGGAGCFVAGTLVTMADGSSKPIEQVRVEDAVRTGGTPAEVAHVAEVITRTVERTVTVEFSPAYNLVAAKVQNGALVTTPEHEVWVDGKGWTLVARLQAGDWLIDSIGRRFVVNRLIEKSGQQTVYTLSNREDHAFYANGLLVRDSCGERRPAGGAPRNVSATVRGTEVAL